VRLAAALLLALSATAGAPSAGPHTKVVKQRSVILGEERTVWVELPANYDLTDRRYQVTYLLDGHVRAFFDMTVAATSYDVAGDQDHPMAPQIVVAIEQKDRGKELGRESAAFRRYLIQELLPFIEKTYRTVPFRTLVGHSLGGGFALRTMCEQPLLFRGIVAVSPSVGDTTSGVALQQCLAASWREDPQSARFLSYGWGDRENVGPDGRPRESSVRFDRFVADSAPPWVTVERFAAPGMSHSEAPFAGIPAGLRLVQSRAVWDLPRPSSDSLLRGLGDPAAVLTPFTTLLARRVGYDALPDAKWLRVAASEYLKRGNGVAAEQWVRRAVQRYPDDIQSALMLALVQASNGDRNSAKRTLSSLRQFLDRADVHDVIERAQLKATVTARLAALDATVP
jgi:predicted alpha/beta superfamily hydrolase